MNLMLLVSEDYNWTVIRNSSRTEYMVSLEDISTKGIIKDFSKFIVQKMIYWKDGLKKNKNKNK